MKTVLEWVYGAHNIYLFIITRVLCACAHTEAKVKQAYSTFYVINIVFQAIFTLLWQIAAALAVGWLFVEKLGAARWTYVPLIIAGVITGLVSMVRFILAAMKSLERIEAQKRKKKKTEENNNGKKE